VDDLADGIEHIEPIVFLLQLVDRIAHGVILQEQRPSD
jgi:hypothetical protein